MRQYQKEKEREGRQGVQKKENKVKQKEKVDKKKEKK